MRVKVSVILPVYNAERYIEECLESLVNQTLKEIEIICVDDGSVDGSLEILRKYEKKDERIKVICQKNLYAGVARNNGMKYATGKYMIFLDSDDFFDSTLLEKTYNEAECCDAEVVLFGARSINDNTNEIRPMPWVFRKEIFPEYVPFNCRDVSGQLLNFTSPNPWSKLFKTEFIKKNNLQFQQLHSSNDVFFVLRPFVLQSEFLM